MYSGTDFRRNDSANVFIKNLDKSIDRDALRETFSSFGNILSCKVETDPSGDSKGFGYVQFDKNESAQDAINALNGKIIKNKKLYVGLFQRKQDRLISGASNSSEEQHTTVLVKNIAESVTEEEQPLFYGQFSPPSPSILGEAASKVTGVILEMESEIMCIIESLNDLKVKIAEAMDVLRNVGSESLDYNPL